MVVVAEFDAPLVVHGPSHVRNPHQPLLAGKVRDRPTAPGVGI
jgi:hypothetical protein